MKVFCLPRYYKVDSMHIYITNVFFPLYQNNYSITIHSNIELDIMFNLPKYSGREHFQENFKILPQQQDGVKPCSVLARIQKYF